MLCDQIWGKIEIKNKEESFKPGYNDLEIDKSNIPETIPEKDLLMTYNSYLNEKFKFNPNSAEKDEEKLAQIKKDQEEKRLQSINNVFEPGNPGIKFKKQFEDMKNRLRLNSEVSGNLSIKIENKKPEEKKEEQKKLNDDEKEPEFNELDKNDKFRIYHWMN